MRKVGLALIGAAAMAGSSAASAAIEFTGSTQGCLQVSAGPCPAASTSNIGGSTGLVFNTGSFDQFTSASGFAAIGSGNTDTLGFFTLGANPMNYTGDLFTLVVNFTLPSVTSGTFAATLVGEVTGANNGGVQITFTNPTQTISSSIGNFTLTVNNVAISGTSGTAAPITGFLQAPVPEPATWALMLVGFAGIGMAMRRRRSPVLAQLA